MILVLSAADPRLAAYCDLTDQELMARHGLFIAEGRLVVRRLLEGGRFRAVSVLVTEPARAAIQDLLDQRPELPAYVVSQAVMNAVTGFNIHRGCLALAERPASPDWRDVAGGARRLLVLERIANADNVGALFRNAAAFGVGAVLLDDRSTDPLYRKAIRTSMGAALGVPFARAEPVTAALHELRESGVAVIGLTPAHTAAPLRDVAPLVSARRLAIVVGHEGDGLTDDGLRACEHLARIPMAAGIDSLNVATAAAIALYELTATATASDPPDAESQR